MFCRPMIIDSDSTLVRTAVELAQRHTPRPGVDDEPWCTRCWAPWPCVAARHAAEVCQAAGLDAGLDAEPYWLESPRRRPTRLEPSPLEPSVLEPSRLEPSVLGPSVLEPSWLDPSWLDEPVPDDPHTITWRLRTPVRSDRRRPAPVFAESRMA